MSKLPKAPLLEVIFELQWKITNQDDVAKFQYLHGDLFSSLKSQYPNRESILNPALPIELFFNKPIHRFRRVANGYPLIQVGPGIICLNANDSEYEWNNYYDWIKELVEKFLELYPLSTNQLFVPGLVYIDFFTGPEKNEFFKYISENFNIQVNQPLVNEGDEITTFNFAFSYMKEGLGTVAFTLNTGKNKDKSGLVMETKIEGLPQEPNSSSINTWVNEAHSFCSNLFKQVTKGNLYDTFK